MADRLRSAPEPMSLKGKLLFGVMGAAAAATSLLASSCAARCSGCMGCLTGGAGIAGVLLGAKIAHTIRGRLSNTQEEGNQTRRTSYEHDPEST